jgi:hypothetical protein
MKAILINGKIYITEVYGALSKSKDVIYLDTQHIKDIHLYSFEVGFDNENYQNIINNKIIIPDFKDYKECVIMKIRMKNNATGEVILFTSDEIICSKYYYFGKPIEDVYPQILGSMSIRISKLEKEVKDLKEKGDIL